RSRSTLIWVRLILYVAVTWSIPVLSAGSDRNSSAQRIPLRMPSAVLGVPPGSRETRRETHLPQLPPLMNNHEGFGSQWRAADFGMLTQGALDMSHRCS